MTQVSGFAALLPITFFAFHAWVADAYIHIYIYIFLFII